MSKFLNPEIHEIAKRKANEVYDRPSAYKSAYIVKIYKQLGGKFNESIKERPLAQWFKEEWKDIGNLDYPVYRPTKRVNTKTPLTVAEIDDKDLNKKIKQKQVYRDKKNLSPFKRKNKK